MARARGPTAAPLRASMERGEGEGGGGHSANVLFATDIDGSRLKGRNEWMEAEGGKILV